MALTVTEMNDGPREFSVGLLRMHFYTYSLTKGDTSASITFSDFLTVLDMHITGIPLLTKTITNNQVDITFPATGDDYVGSILVLGK